MVRFDLRGEGARYNSLLLWYRIALAGIIVSLVGFALYLGALYTTTRAWDLDKMGLVGVCGLFACLFGYIALRIYTPGASCVEVDERQIAFVYSSKRTRIVPWGDPRFRFWVLRTTGTNDFTSFGAPAVVVVEHRTVQTFLSDAAFKSILSIAASKSLGVTEGPSRRPGWTRVTITRPDVS